MADIETSGDWHWRNSMKPVKFFALDARVSLFFLIFIVYMRLSTLIAFFVVAIIFWGLERKGLTFDAALRSLRTVILGPRRPAWLWVRRRKMIDYG